MYIIIVIIVAIVCFVLNSVFGWRYKKYKCPVCGAKSRLKKTRYKYNSTQWHLQCKCPKCGEYF